MQLTPSLPHPFTPINRYKVLLADHYHLLLFSVMTRHNKDFLPRRAIHEAYIHQWQGRA